ncbi:hypothetical protein A7A08_00786 [Methyloligella halotolerans]|uniref:Uncharacterized protein n=1 Tax=Methyloligella halotolerans TaxID=1177755 RepID=A0A1E2S3H7_9HYPH|nr:hypothetical protein [Methyloligella halotolerans]ODA68952.1 hypothetical protein A7A08_00786 [Methyloligella halotolerans]
MVRKPDIAVAEMDEMSISQFTLDRSAMATDWGAIFGGALAAVAVSIILFTAGSGFGFSTVEPGLSPTAHLRTSPSEPVSGSS